MFDEALRASLVGRAPGLAAPPRVDVAAHLVERLARVLRAQGRRRFEGTGLADGPVWKSKFYVAPDALVDFHTAMDPRLGMKLLRGSGV